MPSPSSQASRKKRALAIEPSITTSVQPPAWNASSTFPNCPSFTQVQASTAFSSAGSVWFTWAAATTRWPARRALSAKRMGKRPPPAMRPMVAIPSGGCLAPRTR